MMKLFDFETIAVNKRGEKTKKQIKDMKKSDNPMLWVMVGLLLFGLYALLAALNPNLWNSAWWIVPVMEFIPVIRIFAFWKARQKLLNDAVISDTGVIVYDPAEKSYVIELDNGKSGLYKNLPPGRYRFYHLTRDDWGLSDEPLSTEAEMRSNLNDTLASVFGYNREHLEYCRRRAGAGGLKTAEGLLTINTTSIDDGPNIPDSFTVGKVTFALPQPDGGYALLENIPYRVYYREPEEEETLLKQIADLVQSRKMTFEAIEVIETPRDA
jgi:hypothetical protein